MARSTQRDKIFNGSTVFAVNIRPLNVARSSVLLTAMRTLCRFTLLSSHPLVKSAITYLLTLPGVVVGSGRSVHCVKTSLHFWSSFLKAMSTAFLVQFLASCFRVADRVAIVSRLNLGRGAVVNRLTGWAGGSNHTFYCRGKFRDMQPV